jgi:hypothetical protein
MAHGLDKWYILPRDYGISLEQVAYVRVGTEKLIGQNDG